MYSLIGQIPVASITASTEAHSYPPLSPLLTIIPAIRPTTLWWKFSRTVIITSVTTKIFL